MKNFTDTVFVAWTNLDLTEGRGPEVPLAFCEKESTAERLGKGRYVQGTDCRITEEKIFFKNNRWYGPVYIAPPSKEDQKAEEEKEGRAAALARIQAVGMTLKEFKELAKLV